MKDIKVYDIDYLYLTDDDYMKDYNRDNDLDDEEIQEHIEHLEENKEIIFKFDDYSFDEDEWNDSDNMEEQLSEMLTDETGEYFSNFEWEYLDKSN
jgi:hypothetical protein